MSHLSRKLVRKVSLMGVFSLLIFSIFPFNIGSALWTGDNILLEAAHESTGINEPKSTSPICYRKVVKPDSGKTVSGVYTVEFLSTTYYTDIGTALRDAHGNSYSDDIYIIPGTKVNFEDNTTGTVWNKTQVLLTKDSEGSVYTIDRGDTLVLPYENEDWGSRYSWDNTPYSGGRWDEETFPGTANGEWDDKDGPADSTIERQKKYCQSELILDNGITLNVNGNLLLGGLFGNNSTSAQGQGYISGKYTQISMKTGSTINVNGGGCFCAEGYVKEYDEDVEHSNGININSSGYFYFPLAIADWQSANTNFGVTSLFDIYEDYDAFPLNFFEFSNVQTPVTFNYGSRGVAISVFFGFGGEIDAISSIDNVIIQIRPGGKLTLDYVPEEVSITTYEEPRKVSVTSSDIKSTSYTNMFFSGDVAIQKVEFGFTFMGLSFELSTDQKGFPMSHKMRLRLVDSDNPEIYPTKLTIPDGTWIKFLPGSSLRIDQNCTLNIEPESPNPSGGGRVMIYAKDKYYADAKLPVEYPKTKNDGSTIGDAILINNGKIIANGGIGGNIQTEMTDGSAEVIFNGYLPDTRFHAAMNEFYYSGSGTDGVKKTITQTALGDIDLNNDGTPDSDINFSESKSIKFNSCVGGTYWNYDEVLTVSVSFNVDAIGYDSTNLTQEKYTSAINVITDYVTFKVVDDDDHKMEMTLVVGTLFEIRNFNGIYIDQTTVTSSSGTVTPNTDGTYTAETGLNVNVVSTPVFTIKASITSAGSQDWFANDNLKVFAYDDSTPNSGFVHETVKVSLVNNNSTAQTGTGYASVISTKLLPVISKSNGGQTYEEPTATGATLSGGYYRKNADATEVIVEGKGYNYKSCLLPDTLVTMADGSQRMVKDIQAGDMLMVFDHETGEITSSPVIFNDYETAATMRVINLTFEDKEVGVISEHGFFDLTLNKYVYIDEGNASDYLGHEFYSIDSSGNRSIKTLTNVEIREEYTECYSPVTYSTLNLITSDMLSMPGGISGLFNIFDYDENLKYDEEKKADDIETYGLFTYADFSDYISEDIYNAFNGTYLKVAIGKGMLTWEDILYYIERYQKFF